MTRAHILPHPIAMKALEYQLHVVLYIICYVHSYLLTLVFCMVASFSSSLIIYLNELYFKLTQDNIIELNKSNINLDMIKSSQNNYRKNFRQFLASVHSSHLSESEYYV